MARGSRTVGEKISKKAEPIIAVDAEPRLISSFGKEMIIREYSDPQDRDAVISLWKHVFGHSSGHNEPSFAIDQKLKVNDRLFFVAVDVQILGTVMAGYDGHRGWIYSVAVSSEHRKRGIGTSLLRHAEAALEACGCAKINLQVLQTNQKVVRFYEQLGYTIEPRISMGKKLSRPNQSLESTP